MDKSCIFSLNMRIHGYNIKSPSRDTIHPCKTNSASAALPIAISPHVCCVASSDRLEVLRKMTNFNIDVFMFVRNHIVQRTPPQKTHTCAFWVRGNSARLLPSSRRIRPPSRQVRLRTCHSTETRLVTRFRERNQGPCRHALKIPE